MKIKTYRFATAVAVLLALALVFAAPVGAEEVSSLTGSGTTGDPYVITNIDELKFFRDSVNNGDTTYNVKNKVIKLDSDIDLAGENWIPIGTSTNFFKGVFDGNGKTIFNLTINDNSGNTGSVYLGLFGKINTGSSKNLGVKNLTIENVSITTSGSEVGALAGECYTTKVENITITGAIDIAGCHYVAGAVGDLAYTNADNIDVIDTSADGGTITATGRLVGGIYGWCAEGGHTYQDCDVENMRISSNGMVGGIGGLVHYKNIIKNCSVKNVDIVLTGTLPETKQGYGLIVGCLVNSAHGSTISSNTINDVTVTGYDGNIITGAPDVGAVYDKSGKAVEAKIGDTFFSTLTYAVAKANNGEIINLLANVEDKVEIPGGVTLETNSYYNGVPVAQIGETTFTSFEEAVASIADETQTTITLLKSTEGAGIIIGTGKNIVIDFGGNTYTVTNGPFAGSEGTKTQAFQLLKDSTITMKNGAIVGDNESVKMLIQNYADLTLENMVLDATQGDNNVLYVLSNNNGNVVITGNTQIIAPTGIIAFDICRYSSYDGPFVTVESGVVINGDIEYSSSNYAAGKQHKLVINGGTITGDIKVIGEPSADYLKNNITIYGGTFSSNPSAYIASGYEVVQPGNSYLVQEYVDRSSSSSSSKPVEEPEEPEQPEEPVVEPETPAAPGEATVETEVTDGGEVEFEAPVEEPGVEGGSAAADEDEAKITGVVLPTGTDSEVAFVPVSEQPAPAGQEENTKKVFEINVPSYEKGKAAVIKFTMTVAELAADGKEAADVALWHFDEETGEWTKLVTSYVIVDGVVYFEAITNDFSPFAIIYEDEPAGDMPGNEPQDEPETPASPAPLLGVLAALGAAVVLRRK